MLFKETHKFKVSLVDNKYYYLEVKNDIEFEIEDLHIFVGFQKELGGNILPVLIYPSPSATTNSDLIKYITENSHVPYTKVDAFIIKSLPQKILANLYLKLNVPQRPTRFFGKKEEALKWIEQYF